MAIRITRFSALLLIAAVAGWAGGAAVAKADHSEGVQLGDSFNAGNAGRWLGNSLLPAPGHGGTDRGAGVYSGGNCWRSDVAPINSAMAVGLAGIDEVKNFACSGATTTTLIRDQLPALEAELAAGHEVPLIAVLIGGNNLRFTDIVTQCVVAYATAAAPCNGAQGQALQERLLGMQADVEDVIARIRTMAQGYGQSPRILLQSYPSPLPRGSEIRYPEADRVTRTQVGGCPVYDVDADWARTDAVVRIAHAERAAAANSAVEFLDLRESVAGHEICHSSSSLVDPGPPDAVTAEWMRWINIPQAQGDPSALAHVNAYGQMAHGRCIALWWAGETGNFSCHNTPGGDTSQMFLRPSVEEPPPPPVCRPPDPACTPPAVLPTVCKKGQRLKKGRCVKKKRKGKRRGKGKPKR